MPTEKFGVGGAAGGATYGKYEMVSEFLHDKPK
jgi:hypothetical protein